MLIATATLITLLLFGGPEELFLINALEKGIKKEIIDKDLKKEIKSEISEYKKSVKNYKKQRKNQKKELSNLYVSRTTTKEEFTTLFEEMLSTLKKLQKEAFETRISVLDKISEEEWGNIIAKEKERLVKLEQKNAKKKDKEKSKNPFSKFEATVQALQLDTQTEQNALDHIESLKEQYANLENYVEDTRNKFVTIINNKSSTEQELETIANWNNDLRKKAFFELSDLYLLLSKNVPESEWNTVAKEFKKLVK